jgi:hypothetical protein
MASENQPAPSRPPTTFYFAYGSNLHLKQMKRRCPGSKYIGTARLVNYRWHINERGYANVVETPGHWVDGLVYEINPVDEAKLDINEGVSKNAYAKRYMNVHLYRAPSTLYRRPTSWIVDRGGPLKISRQARQNGRKLAEHSQHWVQQVLVYISLNYVADSSPKEEYVTRINLGVADARALGMDEDYVRDCIRPFIPAPSSGPSPGTDTTKLGPRGQKRGASPRTGEQSPARKGQAPNRPDNQTSQQTRTKTNANNTTNTTTTSPAPPRRRAAPGPTPPPPLPPRPVVRPALPPRPVVRYRDVPIVVVEEFHFSSWSV